MTFVRVEITRWVDDYQPGIVECRLVDADGNEWHFIEKVPVVTSDRPVSASSTFPTEGAIACRSVAQMEDGGGRRTVRITTEHPFHVSAVDGQTIFDVRPDQLFNHTHEYSLAE